MIVCVLFFILKKGSSSFKVRNWYQAGQFSFDSGLGLRFRLASQLNPTIHKDRIVTWHPSKDSDIILNVDGSCCGNPGRAGFGGLLRTNDGRWICGFSGFIGISNNLHVELLGLYRGLRLAWDKGYRNVKYYSDSAHSIQHVSSSLNKWHFYAVRIFQIFYLEIGV